MKGLFIILLAMISILGNNNSKTSRESDNLAYDSNLSCNCHCRIGHYKGQSVKEYSNPVVNLGIVQSWGGPFGATNSKAVLCAKRCRDSAHIPLFLMPKAEFCSKSERFLQGQNKVPMNRLVVYYKVGGRKWQSGDSRFEKCE